jgi:hypothetical protein
MVKRAFQQGRSERKPEAYVGYVEGLSDARTKLKALFNIRHPSRSCTANGSQENMPSR